MTPAHLAAGLATFVVAFWLLSAPRARLPGAVRLVLGALLVVVCALAAVWIECSPRSLGAVVVVAALGSVALRGEGLSRLTDALGRHRFAVYLLSVAVLAALVFVVVPITTFLTSPGEIGIHLDHLLEVNARDAMIVVYLAALLYAFAFTSRMRTMLALLALLAVALGLVYSFVLPFGYPMMTGLTFEQVPLSSSERRLRALVDVAVVALAALALGLGLVRWGGRVVLTSLAIAGGSMAVAAAVAVQRDQVGGAGGAGDDARAVAQPLRFSRTNPNVLVVFLDRFMGSYVESILESDPELADRLRGFVWYPRTVSAGENSIAGVHPIFGGYDYLPVEMNARGAPLRDLSVEAFSILPWNFSRKGYQVNVVNPRGLGFTMAGDCRFLAMDGVTCTHTSAAVAKRKAEELGFPLASLSSSSYADLLVLLGAMRSAPYALKEILRVHGPWRPFMDHSAGTTFREWAELEALGELTRTDATEPTYNQITNILPHEPYYMGEDCRPREERFEASPDEIRRRGHASLFALQHAIAARCSLLAVARYLDHLKAEGVYDDTTIAIVSDHGIVGDVLDTSKRAVAGKTRDNMYVRLRPVLLVKERGAQGPLRTSEEFMPNAELPRLLCRDIGGCVNPYLDHRPIEAAGRDDPFRVSLVPWQFSEQKPDAFVILHALELRGRDPFDAKGWRRVGRAR